MNLSTGMVLTVLLLIGNGFFVAAEFALVAAKRHRLEKAAAHGSRAAAAAVAGIRELSLMLAGAQLGITLCSLGLGVVSEPLIAGTLTPLFNAVGLPEVAAHAVAFVIALGIVTFLHMVIGEMAPKSWAIAHPERSATLLALPFRGFTMAVRPVLKGLNGISNLLLRLFRVQARNEISRPRTPEQLQHLVEESRRLGLIESQDHALLTQTLHAPNAGIASLIIPSSDIVGVSADGSPQAVIDVSARSRRTRLIVWQDSQPVGIVHVRDAYLARRRGADIPAHELSYPALVITAATSISSAVFALRSAHSQIAIVRAEDGSMLGIVSLDDLLTTLLVPA